jgi:thiol:disulfide interchange protein DsbC
MKPVVKRLARLAFLVAAFSVALPGVADEATIRRVVESKLGGARVDGIQPAQMPGLWEVRFSTQEGPRIVYTDDKATYIISGSLYDTRADRNITEERLQKLSAIKFEDLPLDLAVTLTRGSGRRVLAMFSDPYCPACQQFEKELVKVDDITVYVFMYPVIRPALSDQSRSVWCSEDRAQAWLDLALRQKPPAMNTSCANPVDKVLALGRRLGVNSTPTLFMANGERLRGGLSAARLAAALDARPKSTKN